MGDQQTPSVVVVYLICLLADIAGTFPLPSHVDWFVVAALNKMLGLVPMPVLVQAPALILQSFSTHASLGGLFFQLV